MISRVCASGLLLTMLYVLGCGGNSATKVKMIPVKGTVKLDGKPMAEGEVHFVVTGQAPSIVPVKDGAYAGTVAVGKNTVQVFSYKAGPPMTTDPSNAPTKINFIPDRYNNTSKLSADVAEGGANDFPFEVTSR